MHPNPGTDGTFPHSPRRRVAASPCHALLLLALTAAAQTAPIRIVLVGDSTVHNEGGWGPGLCASFGPGIDVLNLAQNGRSSKSFRNEGWWAPALAAKPDYILIQFGHNDCPGKGPERETDPQTTYRENLARYIDEARAAGAQPVLVTSIVRRVFLPGGKFRSDALAAYAEAARSVAAEKKVPLMDMYSLTLAQAEALGPEGCADIDARDKGGQRDRTHLGEKGRREIGAMAARELVRAVPALGSYLLPEVR